MTQGQSGTDMPTLLGFDYGTYKIGVAVGQTVTRTASPLTTLFGHKQQPNWDQISQLMRRWEPDQLVVGLPCDIEGRETELAPRARRFARQLAGRYRLPVHLMDERLTSMEARRHQGPNFTIGNQPDAVAARLILETWMSEN
jgi:putative Holliday junction resolvase